MKRKLLLVRTALPLAEKPMNSISPVKKPRYTFLLYIAAAVLLLSCNDSLGSTLGSGLFSSDDPTATSGLILLPRYTIYKSNGVFYRDDLSVHVTSDGEVIQVPLNQVQITIESDKVQPVEVTSTYPFSGVDDIYTITAQFRGMSNKYTVLVGVLTEGSSSNPGNPSDNPNGEGGGIGIVWP
jgi:hypothetical protein